MKIINRMALAVAVAVLVGSSQPVRATGTDERIVAAFRKSYVYMEYLKDEPITINSKDGVVTLAGAVWNDAHKSMARDVAAALPGVISVDNQIEVKGGPPVQSDAYLKMKVKTALLFHRNVNAHKTEVAVTNGVVRLTGEATSPAERDLTTELVKDIAGVKSVQNEMQVAANPGQLHETMVEAIDDASITAQAKAVLLWHRATGVLRTKVATTEGVVMVGGQARNAAEKELVSKLVADIHGVKSVVNTMVVEKEKKE